MYIPMQVDYGVRALVDLAKHESTSPIKASEIANRQNIPQPYLSKLLLTLQQKGLTKAETGPNGGHSLATKPNEINLTMVMNHLGSPLNLLECIKTPDSCEKTASCEQRPIWQKVEKAVSDVLNTTTISDLIE